MTELEWLASTDPRAMLNDQERKVSDRKLRLFAVACILPVSHLFTDDGSRQAVGVLERLPDGGVTKEERVRASRDARNAYYEAEFAGEEARHLAGVGLYRALIASPVIAAQEARMWAAIASHAASDAAERVEEHQADLLREIFGNPFRPVTLDPARLTPDVLALARTVYDERAFDEMAILGDVLEEAGCDNPDILNHCRGPGPHVRGCWVIDIVLGKS